MAFGVRYDRSERWDLSTGQTTVVAFVGSKQHNFISLVLCTCEMAET